LLLALASGVPFILLAVLIGVLVTTCSFSQPNFSGSSVQFISGASCHAHKGRMVGKVAPKTQIFATAL
jgi:hypothetical protein